MNHRPSRHPLKLQVVHPVVAAGVEVQDLEGNHVADLVKLQTVDRVALGRDRLPHQLGRRGDHLGLDEPQVELHARETRVVDHQGERFAVDNQGLTHRAEFARQVDRPAPVVERPLNRPVEVVAAALQLQPWPGADEVAGERRGDAREVGVVRSLVAGPVANVASHHRRESSVGRECVSVGPVAAIVAHLGGVVPGTNWHDHLRRR